MGAKKQGAQTPLIGITTDVEGEFYKLRRQYADAVLRAGGLPILLPPIKEVSGLAGSLDGFIISGGDDIDPAYYGETPRFDLKIVPCERTDFEFNLIRAIMDLGKPVLGICYGMQAINVALGGTLYQDIKAEVEGPLEHKTKGHDVLIEQGFLLKAGRHSVNSSHHQAVKKGLGRGLEVVARADDGIIEAFILKGYPFLLGIQWHPERSEDGLSREIFDSFIKASYAGRKPDF